MSTATTCFRALYEKELERKCDSGAGLERNGVNLRQNGVNYYQNGVNRKKEILIFFPFQASYVKDSCQRQPLYA